jgi:hypothetical protein
MIETLLVLKGCFMPVNPQFNSRPGNTQFLKFAQVMCRLVNVAAPAIRARYPDREALLAVLTAAETVCTLLPEALSEQALADAMDAAAFDPGDGVVIPGQDA